MCCHVAPQWMSTTLPIEWMHRDHLHVLITAMFVVVIDFAVILRPMPRSNPMVFLNTANLLSMGSVVLGASTVDVAVQGDVPLRMVSTACAEDDVQCKCCW